MWHEVLGDEFLRRPRLSRIYYSGKFFDYPLRPINALIGLGLGRACSSCSATAVAALSRTARRTPSSSGSRTGSASASSDVLQDLHREGMGHLLLRAEGGVGGAADQGPVAQDGHAEHVPQAADDHQDPDRGVRLSALRARHDVGGGRDDVERGGGGVRLGRGRENPLDRPADQRRRRAHDRRRGAHPARARLEHAADRARRDARPAGADRGARGGAAARATATSSPCASSWTGPTCSRTTGSTCSHPR